MPKIEVDEATQKGEKPLNFERSAKYTDTHQAENVKETKMERKRRVE